MRPVRQFPVIWKRQRSVHRHICLLIMPFPAMDSYRRGQKSIRVQHARKERNKPSGTGSVHIYQDIPLSVFPFEIEIGYENERPFLMATPEKAICDKLCTVKPIRSRKHLQLLLFDDLRTDQDAFSQLDFSVLRELCPLYKWTTLTTLLKLTGTWQSDGSSL